jgi:hypothetical protein
MSLAQNEAAKMPRSFARCLKMQRSFAAQRADALLENAGLDGARTWREIVQRINEMQAKSSGPLH